MTRYYRFPSGGASTVSGAVQISGLSLAGRVSFVTVNELTWSALPTVALPDRNALCIQNRSGQEIKLNYDNTVVGYEGIIIDDTGERAYDITNDVVIYCKSKTSSCTVTIEELS